MRNAILFLAILTATACDDGATQTFGPAGASPTAEGPPAHGQQTAPEQNVLCTPAIQRARVLHALSSPVVPGSFAADIDLSGGPGWPGITIEAVMEHFCFDPRTLDPQATSWTPTLREEIAFDFDRTRRVVTSIILRAGYLGGVRATSRTGGRFGDGHTYALSIHADATRDGSVLAMDWNARPSPGDWRYELGDAIAATFFPRTPEQADCFAARSCIQASWGEEAWQNFVSSGLAVWVANKSDPIASHVPVRFDVFPVRPAQPPEIATAP